MDHKDGEIDTVGTQDSPASLLRSVNVGTIIQAEQFPLNVVKTSIYTPLSFVPKNVFKQFTRFSNVYFLFITALQLIPESTSTPGFPTMVVPLVFILLVSAVRDLIEDLDRHRSDNIQNRAPVAFLDLQSQQKSSRSAGMSFAVGICAGLRVGHLVRVAKNEEIPADIVLLASSRAHGQCFVMTSNLDGESTLKPRYVPPELCSSPFEGECFSALGEFVSTGAERILQLKIECERPNRRIDRFEGSINFSPDETVDIDISHILLKGTQLKDTPWVIGVVVYTGDDTRVRQNSSYTPIKHSWLNRFTNKITLWVVLAQIAILTAAVIAEKKLITSKSVAENPYIDDDLKSVGTLDLVYLFLAYMLLFSNFIPISLQVTIDFTRYFQAMVIQRDPDMICAQQTTSRLSQASIAGHPTTVNKHTSVRVQSSELNEELGLIEHVFTDKTGTLTCNRMEFRSCHVDGKTFDYDEAAGVLVPILDDFRGINSSRPQSSLDEAPIVELMRTSDALQDVPSVPNVVGTDSMRPPVLIPVVVTFLLNLAVNNSVSPTTGSLATPRSDAPSELARPSEAMEYSGPSPDEKALVAAAARLGVRLIHRDNTHVTVSLHGENVDLQILQLFEFTSDRKKSSIVVRHPNGRIVLYSKGADSVILHSLNERNHTGRLQHAREQMKVYSSNGLRVLCIAERELSDEEYSAWNGKYAELRAALKKKSKTRRSDGKGEVDSDATQAMASLVSTLERELTLVGISAIEDKIQDGAPETLEKFREAGIKVWMLTGDRPDTAMNVAHAVRLITNDMRLIKLTDSHWLESKTAALHFFGKELQHTRCDSSILTSSFLAPKLQPGRISLTNDVQTAKQELSATRGPRLGMILTDTAVEAVRRFGLESEFLQLCMQCDSVLCARISPKQKEFMIEMVRSRYPDKVTMAVGDGANDVPMIQRAHIGIGIAGEEGHQASDASDYSIPAFRFLQKLVLVHGRSMNRRISVLTLYIFFKNVLLVLPQFVFGIYCLYSGQSSYYDPLLQLFNICFTSLPVLYFSVFDQDISAATSLQYPRLYQDGSAHAFLSMRVFVYWMLEATVASILIILVPVKLIPLVAWSGTGKDNDLWSLGLTQNFAVVFLANARLLLEVSMNHRMMILLMMASVLFWWVVVFVMSSSVSFGREFYGILYMGSLTQLALCCLFCAALSLFVAMVPRAHDILFAPKPRTICRELDYLKDCKDREYFARRLSTEAEGRAVIVPT